MSNGEHVNMATGTTGYTDTELVHRWLRAQRPLTKRIGGMYLWAKVAEDFCVGSTSAQVICRRHGFDPDTG